MDRRGRCRNRIGLRRRGDVRLDAEPGRSDTRGFTEGKLYFFFLLRYHGNSDLHILKSELAGYKWVSREELTAALATTRPEKRKLMLRFYSQS